MKTIKKLILVHDKDGILQPKWIYTTVPSIARTDETLSQEPLEQSPFHKDSSRGFLLFTIKMNN